VALALRMTRAMDRGRVLVLIGAVLALIGMALPWVTVGGHVDGLPETTANGFDGAGILVFVAAILMLALLTLPYASKTGHSSLDSALSYLVLTVVGFAGIVLEAISLLSLGELGLPDRSPGLWLAALGFALAGWGVGELLSGDRSHRF
jgi:putative Ca2+/H+ antiporter (TMEM165/GDT1 family)